MNSAAEFVEVDLHSAEKKLIRELASSYVRDAVTQADLANGRKKWVRFRSSMLDEIIGELSYHYNRCKSAAKSEQLDELIGHLENALSASRR